MFGNGRADDRRRRVLTEEIISGGAKSASPAEAPAKPTRGATPPSNRYGDAARMDRQPRITDLVPQSWPALAAVFVAGCALIAGLEALYYFMPQMARHTTDGRIAAFDLDAEGSLAVFFSSTLLMLAGGTALVVFSLRKHRADDYHGRYRVWLYAALCWFVMAVDESASLHEGFKEMMTGLTGERGFGDGSIWWVGAYALLLGVVGVRLLLDMRECLTSTALLVLAGGCYAAAVVTQLNFILPDSGAQGVMLEEGLEMAGNLWLLLAMAVHVRHVVLEVEGVVKPKAAKSKSAPLKDKLAARAEKAKSDETAAPAKLGWFRRAKIDPPHKTPSPAGKPNDLETTTVKTRVPSSAFRATAETLDDEAVGDGSKKGRTSFDDDEDDSDDRRELRKLSRAERKAMRRQKDNQRRGFDD